MELCFSTLGCPRWTFDEIFATAKDMGLSNVEVRGIGDYVYAPAAKVFQPENIDKTVDKLKKLNMNICILTSGAALALPEKNEAALAEAREYVHLAAKLGTKYIRVMGTDEPAVTPGDLELGARSYREICEYAKDFGVTPLIETNGALSESDKMLSFIESTGSDNCGVLWDIHHPFRFFSETPEYTAGKLGSLIKHVHIKDSALVHGKIEYRMMGYGDVPAMDALIALKESGYNGCISLEWLKRWNPDLQEPGIVFAHFINYMRVLLNQIG